MEVGGGGWRRGGGGLAPNWVPMLEQRIDERTVNNVFQVSVKTTLFAVLNEICIANFDYPEQ